MKLILFMVLLLILFLPIALSEWKYNPFIDELDYYQPTNTTADVNVNRTEFWDELDDPSDILTSELNNDAGFYDSLTDFTGVLTDSYWCRYNLGGGVIDCNVVPFTDTTNTTDEIFDVCNNDTWISKTNTSINTVLINDPSDWDSIGDVPTAIPSDGDTTHLSLADQIFDWVMGLGFITNSFNSSYDFQLGHNTKGNENNLVGYWAFENSNIAYDSSGLENDGNLTGTTWTTGGKYGGGYDFDGISDYVQISDSTSLDITDEITLSSWIYVKGRTQSMEVIRKGNVYIMRVNSGGTTLFYLAGVSDTSLIGNVIPDDTWVHLAMTYNTTHKIIYVNGNQDKIESTTGTITTDNNVLRFGLDMGSVGDFNGTIDEVKIWNTSLSSNQVKAEYVYGITNFPVGEFVKRGDV